LDKSHSALYLTIAIMGTSFLTTIFYGALLQLALLLFLVIILEKGGIIKKTYYVLLAIISFFFFHFLFARNDYIPYFLYAHVQYMLNADVANTADFMSSLYQALGNVIVRPEFVYIFCFLCVSFSFVYMLSRNRRLNKIIISSLFVYLLLSIYFSTKNEISHFGVLQYPLMYLLVVIVSKHVFSVWKKSTFSIEYMLYVCLLFYAVFPQQLWNNYVHTISSKYFFINSYVSDLYKKYANENIVVLSAYERDGVAVYWPTTNFWYYDVLHNPKSFVLGLEQKFCRMYLQNICYTNVPDAIVLVCPLNSTRISAYLSPDSNNPHPMSLYVCEKELQRLTSLIGVRQEYTQR
jgi:hypothetical protein